MRPLDPLAGRSRIATLLKGAPAAEARAELDRLEALDLAGLEAAARAYARGALALRDGSLDAAASSLDEAATAFEQAGEAQAARLARCEAWIPRMRRGPRRASVEATEALAAIARAADDDPLARVVATHYEGAALRSSGDATGAQRALLLALSASEPFLDERAQVLSSLGTLYVVLGAYGAAEALLSHAAELHHRTGDAVGEALTYGQLGSAALGRGDLDRARKYLQLQEWHASRVGDAFGRARALVWLADVALATGRSDDAVELAGQARAVASRVSPPLTMWLAYASRAIARAKIELGDPGAAAEIERARELFAGLGHPLGDALVRWDSARAGHDGGAWFAAAWRLASLGLPARVAELARDRGVAPAVLAAAAQTAPHLAASEEVELVYRDPVALVAVAQRRAAASRNLARLAALTMAPAGLHVAAVASSAIGARDPVIPGERAQAALVAELGGAALWIWPASTPIAEVARDLASLRASLGGDTRAALGLALHGRVIAPPFAGEAGVRIEGGASAATIAEVMGLATGARKDDSSIDWTPDAEAIAVLGGYAVTRS